MNRYNLTRELTAVISKLYFVIGAFNILKLNSVYSGYREKQVADIDAVRTRFIHLRGALMSDKANSVDLKTLRDV